MLRMRRSVRQKVVAGAAVAVLLGGCAFAAVSATGQGDGHARTGKHARRDARRLRPHDLSAAASYLGVSAPALAAELHAGKSLAQIVAAHGQGKSASGLVEAIVTERKARLAKVAANLSQRVTAEVQRPGGAPPGSVVAHGAGALALFTAPGHLGASAASYLVRSPSELRSELRAGKTLAELADATPGKSSVGLVAALLAAKQQRLAAHSARRKLSSARSARLQRRISTLVERNFARAATP